MFTHILLTSNAQLIARAICAKVYTACSNHGPRLLLYAGQCWQVSDVALAPSGHLTRIELEPARRTSIDYCSIDEWYEATRAHDKPLTPRDK